MKFILLIIYFIFIINLSGVNLSPTFDITKLKTSLETDQIMLVIPYSYTSSLARFYYYVKKDDGKWHEIINTESHIGYNGLGKQREGDLKTPIGKFNFTLFFGKEGNPGTKLPYIKVNDTVWWNCDLNSKEYNTMISTDNYHKDFNKKQSEHIIDQQKGYEYIMNINYNPERIAPRGCAIFLHGFTDNYFTEGCVAIPQEKLKKVITMANENSVIIIDELKNIYNY